MQVREYMTSKVVTANLRDGLHQTFERMQECRVRHMPVLDDSGVLVGIVSERDLRRPDFVDHDPNVVHYFALDNTTKVEKAMTADPITVRPDDSVKEALGWFIKRRFGAVPVVDGDMRLVGILSAIDLLKAFQDHLDAWFEDR